jgi:hypothetical protein
MATTDYPDDHLRAVLGSVKTIALGDRRRGAGARYQAADDRDAARAPPRGGGDQGGGGRAHGDHGCCPKIEYGRLAGENSWAGINSRMIDPRRSAATAAYQQFRLAVAPATTPVLMGVVGE